MNRLFRADNVGNTTLIALKRTFRFNSYACFVDPRGKKYILISGSPLLNSDNLTSLILEVQESISSQSALQKALKQGKFHRISQLERTETRRVQLKRVDMEKFKPHDIYPVYNVYG